MSKPDSYTAYAQVTFNLDLCNLKRHNVGFKSFLWLFILDVVLAVPVPSWAQYLELKFKLPDLILCNSSAPLDCAHVCVRRQRTAGAHTFKREWRHDRRFKLGSIELEKTSQNQHGYLLISHHTTTFIIILFYYNDDITFISRYLNIYIYLLYKASSSFLNYATTNASVGLLNKTFYSPKAIYNRSNSRITLIIKRDLSLHLLQQYRNV